MSDPAVIEVEIEQTPAIVEVNVAGLQGPKGDAGDAKEFHSVAGGIYNVDAATDDIIFVTAVPATINLPAVASRADSRWIKIVDGTVGAGSNNITITPNGSETILGQSEWKINFDGGEITLWPRPDDAGWFI
ncbi:MAG: hypothetical protein AAGF48_12945 [Pseudomonadota bacterium]